MSPSIPNTKKIEKTKNTKNKINSLDSPVEGGRCKLSKLTRNRITCKRKRLRLKTHNVEKRENWKFICYQYSFYLQTKLTGNTEVETSNCRLKRDPFFSPAPPRVDSRNRFHLNDNLKKKNCDFVFKNFIKNKKIFIFKFDFWISNNLIFVVYEHPLFF